MSHNTVSSEHKKKKNDTKLRRPKTKGRVLFYHENKNEHVFHVKP